MLAPIQLAENGPKIPRLVPGVMTWGVWGHQLSASEIQDLIEHCLSIGLTTFDHADIYGHYTTEAAFGEVLKEQPHLRQEMQLISKCGIKMVCKQRPDHLLKSYDTSREHIIRSAEKSLQNLHTDYLDLLLIHRPNPLMHVDEVAEAIASLKQHGKIRHFGVSNFSPAEFSLLQEVTPLVTNQIEISLLHSTSIFDGTLQQLMQHRIRPMAWSPLGGIFKREDEQAQRTMDKLDEIGEAYNSPGTDVMMLAWLLRHPAGIIPILGTARKERLSDAARALDIELSQEEWFALLEAARGQEVA